MYMALGFYLKSCEWVLYLAYFEGPYFDGARPSLFLFCFTELTKILFDFKR
jgi:hypothetical protein